GQLGGWKALIYARLFLAAIYDFISYAAGFTRTITLLQYVLVSTFVGLIPTGVFVAAGTSLAGGRVLWLVFYGLLGVLSLIPLGFSWLRHRRAQKSDTPASLQRQQFFRQRCAGEPGASHAAEQTRMCQIPDVPDMRRDSANCIRYIRQHRPRCLIIKLHLFLPNHRQNRHSVWQGRHAELVNLLSNADEKLLRHA